MSKNRFERSLQSGRLLIEVLVVIAIMMMFLAVMYTKQVERRNEVQDVSIAEQMRGLLGSVKSFVEVNRADIENAPTGTLGPATDTNPDTGIEWDLTWCTGAIDVDLATGVGGCMFTLNDPNVIDRIRPYLPEGSVNAAGNLDDNQLYRDFAISIRRNDTIAGSEHIRPLQIVMVSGRRVGGRELDNRRATRLSAMIGGAGGFIRNDDPGTGTAMGSQGVWRLDAADYFHGDTGAPIPNLINPVRIVMSSDFESHHVMLGTLNPYFDFFATRPGHLRDSVGMVGDMIFLDQDARIQFGDFHREDGRISADEGTLIRIANIDTDVMTLDQIRNYFGSPDGNLGATLPYTINMDTGRIFINTIRTVRDAPLPDRNPITGRRPDDPHGGIRVGFAVDSPAPAGSPAPAAPGVPAAQGHLTADGSVAGGEILIRNPNTGTTWRIITSRAEGDPQQRANIVNIQHVTASGQIQARTLEIGSDTTGLNTAGVDAFTGMLRFGGLADANRRGQARIGRLRDDGTTGTGPQHIPGTITTQGHITTPQTVRGRIRSTRVARPGDACVAGEVAHYRGSGTTSPATLTCFNARFTRTHPAYSCPQDGSRLVQRPRLCIGNPGHDSCRRHDPDVLARRGDPILCERLRYTSPADIENRFWLCSSNHGHNNFRSCQRRSVFSFPSGSITTCRRCAATRYHPVWYPNNRCSFRCPAGGGWQRNTVVCGMPNATVLRGGVRFPQDRQCAWHLDSIPQCRSGDNGCCAHGGCGNFICVDQYGDPIDTDRFCFRYEFSYPTTIY